MNKSPRFKSMRAWGIGSGVQMVRARVRAKIGAMMNIGVEDV